MSTILKDQAAARLVRDSARTQQPVVRAVLRPPESWSCGRGDHSALGSHTGDADRVLETVVLGRRAAGAVFGVGEFRSGVERGDLAVERRMIHAAFRSNDFTSPPT